MKNIAKSIILIMAVCSCRSDAKKEKISTTSVQSSSTYGKKFFEYDEIDHYSSAADEGKLMILTQKKGKSVIDSFTIGVILDNIPKDISDLGFIDKLNALGFKKSSVRKSKFSQIDSLFIEKIVDTPIWLTCIHLYRDILIFKKQNKVIGTAKICFSCMANQITGTNANTENFGQEGDYERLQKILSK